MTYLSEGDDGNAKTSKLLFQITHGTEYQWGGTSHMPMWDLMAYIFTSKLILPWWGLMQSRCCILVSFVSYFLHLLDVRLNKETL